MLSFVSCRLKIRGKGFAGDHFTSHNMVEIGSQPCNVISYYTTSTQARCCFSLASLAYQLNRGAQLRFRVLCKFSITNFQDEAEEHGSACWRNVHVPDDTLNDACRLSAKCRLLQAAYQGSSMYPCQCRGKAGARGSDSHMQSSSFQVCLADLAFSGLNSATLVSNKLALSRRGVPCTCSRHIQPVWSTPACAALPARSLLWLHLSDFCCVHQFHLAIEMKCAAQVSLLSTGG